MASGVNTTFRQIGISVGIAVYGTIFTTVLRHDLTHKLSAIPGAASHTSLEHVAYVQTGRNLTDLDGFALERER